MRTYKLGTVTGPKWYSKELKQGGLGVPAKTTFRNTDRRMIDVVEEYNKKHL